jgi:hypothetical protein
VHHRHADILADIERPQSREASVRPDLPSWRDDQDVVVWSEGNPDTRHPSSTLRQ